MNRQGIEEVTKTIKSLIFQINAHLQLNICILTKYPTCAVLREKSDHF
jgi:hypothetical protein